MEFITVFENFINEYRNKDVYSLVRPLFKNTPEYVFKELYYPHNGYFKNYFIELINNDQLDDIEDDLSYFIDLKWKKKLVEVNINDFCEHTRELMIKRGIGEIPYDVPKDEMRTKLQKDIAIKDYGKNEPVIMTEMEDGYQLYEGWHRAMAILSLGSDGTTNYDNWKKVKLNAWIGR